MKFDPGFWEKIGANLELKKLDTSFEVLLDVFRLCPRLETLSSRGGLYKFEVHGRQQRRGGGTSFLVHIRVSRPSPFLISDGTHESLLSSAIRWASPHAP